MVERASRHVKLLSETIATVTSSLDLDEVAGSVARGVARALQADACFVYTYDDAAHELVLQAVYGTSIDRSGPRPRMRLGEGLTGDAAARRAPVAIAADADRDPRSKRFAGLDEDRFASFLAVPILDRRGQLAGAINVRTADRQPGRPGAGERVLLRPRPAPRRRTGGADPHRRGGVAEPVPGGGAGPHHQHHPVRRAG